MRVPKERKAYCRRCGKHTVHAVTIYKKGNERKKRAEGWRRYNRKKKGYGSQPKEIFRKNSKVNKKTLPMLKCRECNHVQHGTASRLRKFELY
ncbi:MAG: 50S ribosomal protein L44e [Promethearchaeota archaeon]